jgi:2-polyprenyl-3-methyl-5-hydroxy-6-metoxy-1,4-benzoquinol methylase
MKTVFKFEKFPLSVCTQEGNLDSEKELLIPAFIEEDETGLITFLPYVDPKLIYLAQHNSSLGKTWQGHNDEFAKYVLSSEKESVVDVGGGSGNIYKSYIKYNQDVKWKIIDLNPTLEDSKVTIIKGYYNPEYINSTDTVITSHFVEHLADLRTFLVTLRERNPKQHIFTLPNFKQYAKSNYSATLMFEHPHYLTEDYLDYILANTGWEIVDKHYYKDHSIFFTTKPATPKELDVKFDCSIDIVNFLDYMQQRADSVKHLDKFYLFGAHFTYYYMLNMGIREDQIAAVVDNDTKKQNRRMYGTNTPVIGPQDLPEGSQLFVEMGPYNEEIKNGLPNIIFI